MDGARKRAEALELVREAEQLGPQMAMLRERAGFQRARSESMLAEVPSTAPQELKAEAWALADEASRLDREAKRLEVNSEQLLIASLGCLQMSRVWHCVRTKLKLE